MLLIGKSHDTTARENTKARFCINAVYCKNWLCVNQCPELGCENQKYTYYYDLN